MQRQGPLSLTRWAARGVMAARQRVVRDTRRDQARTGIMRPLGQAELIHPRRLLGVPHPQALFQTAKVPPAAAQWPRPGWICRPQRHIPANLPLAAALLGALMLLLMRGIKKR